MHDVFLLSLFSFFDPLVWGQFLFSFSIFVSASLPFLLLFCSCLFASNGYILRSNPADKIKIFLSPSGIHEARGPTKKIRFLRRSPLFCSSLFFKTCTMFPLKHRSSIPPSHPLSKKATKTHTSGSSRRSQLSMRAYDVQTTTDRNRIATRLRQEQEQQHHYFANTNRVHT